MLVFVSCFVRLKSALNFLNTLFHPFCNYMVGLRVLLLGLLLALSFGLRAETPVPAVPAIAAEAYVLQDFHSGRIIAQRNADTQIAPASITKVMTAYVIFDAINSGDLSLYDHARVSKKAWRNPGVSGWMKGSRMFAEVNSQIPISELLRGLIVQSGNDAAITLAEHIAGTEAQFVKIMNQYADRMGLKNTRFQNSTGWPSPDHYSTARDIAALSRAIIRDFPELYKIFSEKNFTYNNISQTNRNTLLWKDETVDGVKTGHTEAAGYCLTASAEREGMRLISVVMGVATADARVKFSKSLLNYGFRFYETHRLFAGNAVLKETRIWKGDTDHLQLGVEQDVYVTIPRGQYEELRPIMNVRKSIFAPMAQGGEVGRLDIYLGERLVYQYPLVALNSIERGNIFQQIADQIAYLLQ